MACFHPLEAWQLDTGEIVFREMRGVKRALMLPCGRCIGCRLVRVRSWAIRCVHESRMHKENCFVTLTYDDKNYFPSLRYRDFQLFMKKARHKFGPFRFYMCGEYGSINWRPHFHALFFGKAFFDGPELGENLFNSRSLSGLWGKGFVAVGGVTHQSAAYCASYALKKVTGDRAERHYTRLDVITGEVVQVVPEFSHMSLRPGIGYSWFQKYWRDVYVARDGVVRPGGQLCPPPRYYDKLLMECNPSLYIDKEVERWENSKLFEADCTEARLLVREQCAVAKQRFLKRAL